MGKTSERNGEFGKEKLHRKFRKIDPEKLKTYIAKHPDAYQSEMAEAFGCSEIGIRFVVENTVAGALLLLR